MEIVKCGKCGKLIHLSEKCCYCGSSVQTKPIEKAVVHDNVADKYQRMEALLVKGQFEEALALSEKVLEWMPKDAEVFWLRLLAKNSCTNDAELIKKGFDCEGPEFSNALQHATAVQKSVYVEVQNKLEEIQRRLSKALSESIRKKKLGTDLVRINEEMPTKVAAYRKELHEMWSALEKIEEELFILEMDCKLLSHEYKESLEAAHMDSSSLKLETYRKDECTAEELHMYQVRLSQLLQMSELSIGAIREMKNNHPWVKEFKSLVKKRDQQIAGIEDCISKLRQYEDSVQEAVSTVEKLDSALQSALSEIAKGNFQSAKTILGSEQVAEIIRSSSAF